MWKKKILIVQPGYAHYRNQLFEILSKRHGVQIIYINTKNTYPGDSNPGNYNYRFLKSRSILKPLEYFIYLIKLRPEIVISSISSSYRSLISYLYAIIFKKKFILWIIEWKEHPHNESTIKDIARKFKFVIGRHLIRKCNALIVGGSASKNFATSLGKNENEIFVAIQCSNDLLDTYKKNSIIVKNKKKFTFLYMSRIIPRKGLDLLITAFHLLKSEREDIRLIIGGDGYFSEHCKRLARSLKVGDIIFLGPVASSNVGSIMNVADVFVFPCHFNDPTYEPWGLVVNEALSAGTPVITTLAVGAAHDLITHQYNGLIVKENSMLDLYNAMNQLLTTDMLPMKYNARLTFEKFNQFEKMADGFTEAIEHVCRVDA